ncbi:MAG: epoxide hydrolase family protein, partial [Pseudomonadota bacterium]
LTSRLERVRLAPDLNNADWSYGTEAGYLAELCRYWARDFDWRTQEKAINAWPHFKTEIDGTPIHFMHIRGKGPEGAAPLPLILNHGWPWTFWDYYKTIGPLSDPAAFGGDPADAFDLVVPSLPGFGFSTPLQVSGLNFWRTADLWVELMDRLGYGRFASFGSDWGGLVTSQLGHKYADRMLGIYLTFAAPLSIILQPLPTADEYGPDEQDMFARTTDFFTTGSGYSAIQFTRPQSIGHALNDSPAGLASWMVEKRRAWSDCKGDVESVFTKGELLTTLTIYWATQTAASSARYYAELLRQPWSPAHAGTPLIDVPTGFAAFEQEVLQMPRSWFERTYDLQRYNRFSEGGHFAAMEQPTVVVDELRAFFRPLRSSM